MITLVMKTCIKIGTKGRSYAIFLQFHLTCKEERLICFKDIEWMDLILPKRSLRAAFRGTFTNEGG